MAETGVNRKHCMILLTIPKIIQAPATVAKKNLLFAVKSVTDKDVKIQITEIKRPELDAFLVAEQIANQIEGRISFRRAMKTAISATMRMGAEGIRIKCSGRLGGAEMARTEQYKEGRIPLHTIRADIDYANGRAETIYGSIGIKVWICRGEILGKRSSE